MKVQILNSCWEMISQEHYWSTVLLRVA